MEINRPDLIPPIGSKRVDIVESDDVGKSAKVILISNRIPNDLFMRVEGFGQGLNFGWAYIVWRIKVNGLNVSAFNRGNPLRDQISDLTELANIFIVIDPGSLLEIEIENLDLFNAYLVACRIKGWYF